MIGRPRVLSFEGQLLHIAGNAGNEEGAACARDMMDGAANALLRLEGPVDAAKFTFLLSDRVVARVRTSTECAPPLPDAAPLPKLINTAMSFWAVYWQGWAMGAIVGAIIACALMRA